MSESTDPAARAASREADSSYRALVEGLPELVCRVDADGVLTYANRACCEHFRAAAPELVGRRIHEFSAEEDRAELVERLASLRADAPSSAAEWRVVLEDGSCRWYHWTHHAVFDAAGAITEYQFVGRDVTEERVVKERLQRDQRLASIGTLATGIAHEVNNPIGAILLAAQSALRYLDRGDSPGITREALELVEAEALRCGRIVKNVLSFASSESAEHRPADVDQTLENARQLTRKYTEGLGAETVVEVEDDLGQVVMNPTEIEQVLVNLIRNAAEAGGGVTRIRVAAERSGSKVRISVADDGPGMPPEILERSFDPFYSTREGWTGMGLSVAHGIVSRHRGEVHIESEPGRGTTISFELPSA